MQLILIAIVIAFAGGGVLGYLLCAHIHSVAAKVTEATQRAVTLPSTDVAKLNAAVTGLGDALQASSADLKQHVSNTVNAAVATLPQQSNA